MSLGETQVIDRETAETFSQCNNLTAIKIVSGMFQDESVSKILKVKFLMLLFNLQACTQLQNITFLVKNALPDNCELDKAFSEFSSTFLTDLEITGYI